MPKDIRLINFRWVGKSQGLTIPPQTQKDYDLVVGDKLMPLPSQGDSIIRFKIVKGERLEELVEGDAA